MSSEPAFRSPKPLPLIRDPTFIPKSAGGSVAAPAPPAAPSKPTSPHARSAPRLSVPQYYAGSADIILKSPHFNSRSKRPILEQCFDSIQKIGEGSFAEVFRARSKDDGQIYAIKKSKSRFRSGADRTRKLAEIENFKSLGNSPFCLQYFRAWIEDEILYIQTEFCSHGSLKEYGNQVLSVAEIWRLLGDCASGIEHIHKNDMVHMDIKPANLFLDGSNCVKIGDFGIAVQRGLKSEFGDGDPAYIAPELLADSRIGPEADIFSLGITFLELVSNSSMPSRGPDWHAIREGRIPSQLLKSESLALSELVRWMLAPDPRNRFSASDLSRLARRLFRCRCLMLIRNSRT
eukprot:m.472947 g.472947  ORF g.472947 m.472947 type:complete len:347 (-) comp57117_c0_seq1:89-1129(-)